MNKRDVTAFFDRLAPNWDAELVRDDGKIRRILDCAGVQSGANVLDVACGTGVLTPDILARGVRSVVGVDIAPNMIAVAQSKFDDSRARFVLADIEEASFPEPFDCAVVYNAFPHFPDPARLIEKLARLLTKSGRLTVAHGMGRNHINRHHAGTAQAVSVGLMDADDLAALFEAYFRVDTVVSEPGIYIVSGRKLRANSAD